MEAKVKDLLKSGVVLVATTDLNKFIKYAVSMGVFPHIGATLPAGVIVTEG